MPRQIVPTVDRFMKFVSQEPNSGCWLWTGNAHVTHHYGMFQIQRRKSAYAHRVAYELFVGEIPSGLCVCHRCDVRTCVNPDHLFVATRQGNMTDMANKGRGTKSNRGLPYGVNLLAHSEGQTKRYVAQVVMFGVLNYLGLFHTPEQAGEVAMQFKQKHLPKTEEMQ